MKTIHASFNPFGAIPCAVAFALNLRQKWFIVGFHEDKIILQRQAWEGGNDSETVYERVLVAKNSFNFSGLKKLDYVCLLRRSLFAVADYRLVYVWKDMHVQQVFLSEEERNVFALLFST